MRKLKQSVDTSAVTHVASHSESRPLDRYLVLGSIAVVILLWVLPRTSFSIWAGLVVIFGLLCHPTWRCAWIEDRKIRQALALSVLAAALTALGMMVMPKVHLDILVTGVQLIGVINPNHAGLRVTMKIKNTGDASTYAEVSSVKVTLPNQEITGDELIGEKKPYGSTDIQPLNGQELLPDKPLWASVTFDLPVSLPLLHNAVCSASKDSDGWIRLTVTDAKQKRPWTWKGPFRELIEHGPCRPPQE